jgi:NAD(P)-dependent dehydrogenase (short-subunit alcohol dehydrogenase family)
MDVRLDGKVALITGGSLGLGRAMALRFAEAGASVAITARGADALEATRREIQAVAGDDKVAIHACDVAHADQCTTMHAAITEQLGPIDILVNNAGTSQRGPFLEVSDELWRNDLDLKLFAAIRLARLTLPGMQERKWGRIINVLNVGAKAPVAEGAPTAVSRAAGMALTKVLAGEAAKHNVLVNALLVGLIDSNQHVVKHEKSGSGESYEAFLEGMADAQKIPLGRVGRAEEFADIACFLASDRASYLSGVAINVDGGRSPVV